ncbi:putative 3-hydroxyisobutyrate dehydrogenase [Diplodia seriata]|uniref:Putative 3-hydroxyisobutyrate dehydrogenase n=1 Tax=Diplodia seriata TaxID=420778 RepID=A0A0G2GAV6_9PEZI|nr:putative 3-hydroxyisobutyrate dehydrogenase [Diplodia seriata]
MAERTHDTTTAGAGGAFGFIGLGAMGTPMAANIRRKLPATTALYIHDPNASACAAFSAAHSAHGPITIAPSAAAVATRASTLISIVPAAPHARAVYLDPATGVVAAPANAHRLMLECSTIDVATTRAGGG